MIKALSMILALLFLCACGPGQTLVPTLTPEPTVTVAPTPTPKPPDLKQVMITKEDINDILGGNFYISSAILEDDDSYQGRAQVLIKGYVGIEGGLITITMVTGKYLACSGAIKSNQQLIEPDIVFLDNPLDQIKLPDDYFMGKSPDNKQVFVGFSLPEVCVNIDLDTNAQIEPEDTLAFLVLLIQEQVTKLNQYGYY